MGSGRSHDAARGAETGPSPPSAPADRLFRLVVESSPNGVVMVDRRGTIVLVNRETERLFGYHRDELLGQSIEMLVPAQLRPRHPDLRATFHGNPQARIRSLRRRLDREAIRTRRQAHH